LTVSPRKTLVLLVLAGTLGAFIAFVERPLRQARHAVEDRHIFPGLDPASIQAVDVQIAGRPVIRAERTNDAWALTRPIQQPADGHWVNVLLTNLARLHWEGRLRAAELDGRVETMQGFGLADPRATISLHLAEGTLQLLIGTNTAAGDQIYLRQGGGTDVYLVAPMQLGPVPIDSAQWRSRRLFPEGFAGASRLRVRSASGTLDLERSGTTGIWRMTAPWNARADNARIRAAIDAFRTNIVLAFVTDAPTDLQPFGLESPALEVLVGSGDPLDRGLVFGSLTTNTPPWVHAKRPREDSVFQVSAEALAAWSGLPKDFLDRRIIDCEPGEILALEIATPGAERTRIAFDETKGWTFGHDPSALADTDLLADAFAILTGGNTELERAVVTDFKPYGLDAPLLEYTVTYAGPAGTNRTVTARFGAGTNGVCYVHRTDEDAVTIMPPAEFFRLPQAAWQFKDRTIWSFAPDEVASVTVVQKGTTRQLVRKGENDWQVARGAADIVNPFGVEEALLRLGTLRAEFWTGRADGDLLRRCGFEAQDYTLTIELVSGRKLVLALGNPSPYHNPYGLAEVDGASMVFEFPLELHYNFVREFLSPFKTGTL
jgi:hypothetical protein